MRLFFDRSIPLFAVIVAAAVFGSIATAAPLEFTTIPTGSFIMGSSPGEPGHRSDEAPLRKVLITHAFRLSTTEVNRALWLEVMGEDPGYFTAGMNTPIESITWSEAVDFCNALSVRDGLTPAYEQRNEQVIWDTRADGYRLPTETEWEYACRAGTTTAFNTGRCLSTNQANFNATRTQAGCPSGLDRHEPLAIGSFEANAWGLYDMHGNVAEWCWCTRDDEAVSDSPLRITSLEQHQSLRGGAWFSLGTGCRSAARFFVPSDSRYDFLGLRLATSVVDSVEVSRE